MERDTEAAANCLICMINQTNYLLDQQLRQHDRRFLEEGGMTERLYRMRQERRRTMYCLFVPCVLFFLGDRVRSSCAFDAGGEARPTEWSDWSGRCGRRLTAHGQAA